MNPRSNTNRRWRRRTLVTGAAVLAVLAVGGSVALATIPDGGGAINGCYAKRDGSLRVIDAPSATCKSTETALTWNQAGPQGPRGDTGPQGPKGDQGAQGRRGRRATPVLRAPPAPRGLRHLRGR